MGTSRKIFWTSVFAVAFALVESSIVVYLRALYYPEGFSFPLRLVSQSHIAVELSREFATMIILVTAGILAGTSRWQKFAYFMIAFGMWDIFYYLWLKVMLNWPASLFEWDVLFLLPVPWIGPVIAPVLISALMIVSGLLMIRTDTPEGSFRPTRLSWILSLAATAVILFSLIYDLDATLRLQMPQPYRYELLIIGFLLYIGAMIAAFRTNTHLKRT